MSNHLLPVSARIPAGKKQEFVHQAMTIGIPVGELVAVILTNYDLASDSVKIKPTRSKPPGNKDQDKKLQEENKKLKSDLDKAEKEVARLKEIEKLAKAVEKDFFSGRTSALKTKYQALKQRLGITGRI